MKIAEAAIAYSGRSAQMAGTQAHDRERRARGPHCQIREIAEFSCRSGPLAVARSTRQHAFDAQVRSPGPHVVMRRRLWRVHAGSGSGGRCMRHDRAAGSGTSTSTSGLLRPQSRKSAPAAIEQINTKVVNTAGSSFPPPLRRDNDGRAPAVPAHIAARLRFGHSGRFPCP